jgi:hypothetical protein
MLDEHVRVKLVAWQEHDRRAASGAWPMAAGKSL